MEKMKYVRLQEYDSIIIFPCVISHDDFCQFLPISAGFCYITEAKVKCFGESISLKLKSDPDDSKLATKQYCGIEAMIKML
jgi:hypothetical protein